jgi:hypothetical protein
VQEHEDPRGCETPDGRLSGADYYGIVNGSHRIDPAQSD